MPNSFYVNTSSYDVFKRSRVQRSRSGSIIKDNNIVTSKWKICWLLANYSIFLSVSPGKDGTGCTAIKAVNYSLFGAMGTTLF
jgi:hypothetical protein